MEKIMRLREVILQTGLGRSAIYRRLNDGQFPQPLRLGDGPTSPLGWKASEVEAWIEARPLARVS